MPIVADLRQDIREPEIAPAGDSSALCTRGSAAHGMQSPHGTASYRKRPLFSGGFGKELHADSARADAHYSQSRVAGATEALRAVAHRLAPRTPFSIRGAVPAVIRDVRYLRVTAGGPLARNNYWRKERAAQQLAYGRFRAQSR